MRKTKSKHLKKYALLTVAAFLICSGVTLADTNWDNFVGQTGTNRTLGGDATATSTLQLTPPVPAGDIKINGQNYTVDGTGYASSIIENSTATEIKDMNIKNGSMITGTDPVIGGGAIHNTSSGNLTVTSTATDPANRNQLSNNKGLDGGAVLNQGTMKIENILFSNNEAQVSGGTHGFGGAVYNNGTLSIINSAFTDNTAGVSSTGYGGAIHNENGTVTITNTDFEFNHAGSGDGGAISNRDNLTITGGTFNNNSAGANGGAIVNGSNASAVDIDANLTIQGATFKDNTAITAGGAIYNRTSDSATNTTHTVHIKQGTTFEHNNVANGVILQGSGGAILNSGAASSYQKDAVLIIDGTANDKVQFKNNIAIDGGAIYNVGTATINNAVFESNGVENPTNAIFAAGTSATNGGAIYNSKDGSNYAAGSMTISNSEFNLNVASDKGGAIYNDSTIEISNSKFDGNHSKGLGGAIYNAGTATITDTDFVGNTAGNPAYSHSNGGAIYTEAVDTSAETIIRATGKDVNIGDSSSIANVSDSIYLKGSQSGTPLANNYANVTFQASEGKAINVNSNIAGNTIGGELLGNVNIGDKTSPNAYTGTVYINGDAKIATSNVNIYGGTLSMAHDAGLDSTNILNMYGGTLDLLNGEYGQFGEQLKAKQFNLLGDSNIQLDVDLAGKRMDGIYKANFENGVTNPGNNKLTVTDMYSWTDTKDDDVRILFTDADALIGNVVQGDGAKIVSSPTSKYEVTQYDRPVGSSDQGVYYGFTRIGDSDPAISGAVAAQGAFLLMDNLYRQSFANMDMVTMMSPQQRMAWKMRNRYADAGYHRGVYAPNVIPEERDGWYMRPFTNFESVRLKNGPKVSNVFYGSLIGGESDIIDLGHGWDGNFSFFGAYSGAHQAYNGVDIWQNAGTLGAVATAYKGNFFTGITANVGASAAQAHHTFGNDQFPILMTGAAWKSGYNIGLADYKFVIQPSYMMSYTFVNVFDYNSDSGVRFTQDPLHAIEIIPGLRLIGNLKNGWQPYLGCNMTWNIMDRTKFYADETALAPLSVKPYFEYGAGLQKRYGDRFTGFGQAMFRNGGRNGVAFTLGMRWALGH